MTTKSIKNLILACSLCCGAAAALTACHDTVDDYFPQTATQRLQSTVSRLHKLLTSADYGWEFEYYPSSDLSYGGIVYTVRFDSLTATVGCSLIPDSTATSLYRITNDNGPVLTFDSYNPLMHYFSTPSAGEYEGKGGEFEFVVDSIGDDQIVLYGKKTRNTMYLRRLTGSPDDYAAKTINIFDHFVDSLRGTIGSRAVSGCFNPSDRSLQLFAGTDTLPVAHYTFNSRGIRLYRPLRIEGKSLQSFVFDTATKELRCTDPGADDVVLQGVPRPANFMSYPKYEADYTLVYKGGSVNVHLKPNRLEGTYLLQGLSSAYDLVLNYDAATGNLTLGSQVVAERDGRTYYWVCYNYTDGSLSLADEGQFTISWNQNRFYPVFNFTTTNPKVLDCDGGLLIYVYLDENDNYHAAVADDGSLLTNGSALFEGLKSLNRKTRMED